MKRHALSAVNTNLTRAEKLVQWKEAKSQAADVKKRPRTAEPASDDLKKNLKLLENSVEEKNSKIVELQNEIESQSTAAKAMTDRIRKLEDTRFKMESNCETLHLQIRQLKDVLRKAVGEHDQHQETVRDLQQKCDEIPAMHSYIAELSLLITCLGEPSPPTATRTAIVENIVTTDKGLARVLKSEKMALQAEIRALKSSNDSLQLRCVELQLNAKLLQDQNTNLQENATNHISGKDEENRAGSEAEREEPTPITSCIELTGNFVTTVVVVGSSSVSSGDHMPESDLQS